MELTAEKIENNFNQFKKLVEIIDGDNKIKLLKLTDDVAERLALAPAASKKHYHGAYPGGLVQHSLNVCKNALSYQKNVVKATNVSNSSIISCSLFHDLGKIGDENEYYIPGYGKDLYVHNPQIQYMMVPHRSLYLLQTYGVLLTKDEYIAILIHDGYALNENKSYCLNEPILSHIIMTADYLSTMQEKQIENKT